jgi:hypothetical protein
MKEMTLQMDDELLGWVIKRKGDMKAEEFIKKALREYMAIDTRATGIRIDKFQEKLTGRLDELESRIGRLNKSFSENNGEIGRH